MKFLFVVDQLSGYHVHWSFIWWNQHAFIEWTTHRLLQSLDFNSCQENTQNWNWWNCVVQNYPTKACCFHHARLPWRLGRFFRGLQLKSVAMTSGYFSLLCCSAFKRNPNLEMDSQYGGFRKLWYSQIIHFNRVFLYKPSNLGYPYFWKHPYSWAFFFCLFSSTFCLDKFHWYTQNILIWQEYLMAISADIFFFPLGIVNTSRDISWFCKKWFFVRKLVLNGGPDKDMLAHVG